MKKPNLRSVEEKQQLVLRQKNSGQTVQVFCKQNAIPEASFYKWRKQFQEDINNVSFIELKDTKQDTSTVFTKDTTTTEEPMDLSYGKFKLQIPVHFNQQQLHEILKVVNIRQQSKAKEA